MASKHFRYHKWLVKQLENGWILTPHNNTYVLTQRKKFISITKHKIKHLLKRGFLLDVGSRLVLRSGLGFYSRMVIDSKSNLAHPIQIKNFSVTPKGRKILTRLKRYNDALY